MTVIFNNTHKIDFLIGTVTQQRGVAPVFSLGVYLKTEVLQEQERYLKRDLNK
jgi:hypothetical protein